MHNALAYGAKYVIMRQSYNYPRKILGENMSIAVIAPYENLRSMALQIIEERKYPAKVYQGDMDKGVEAARLALAEGARILVSRGGTAIRINRVLDVDVLEIRPSVYSAFAFIHAHTRPDDRIAIAGFHTFINICRPACDILHRRNQAFGLNDAESAPAVMDTVAAWKPDIVIGDVISVRLAKSRNLNCQLIESSRETLIEALDQAATMLNHLNRHHDNERKLSAVLNCAKEGAFLLNSGKRIEEVNLRGCELLHLKREQIVGRPLREIFPDEEINAAADSATSLQNALAVVNGRRYVMDIVCSSAAMEADSVVALFQKVEHIQQTETSIRTKLMDRGFHARYTFDSIIHAGPDMRRAIHTARDYAKTECNIMIHGETGTGKELFAQSIHNAGPRAKGPFVAVNCAALPGTLLESELFGYAPGAFTGALRSGKTGLFELAHNGTLFLDEIAEMDVFLQARLLRTLQAREIMRLGDNKVIPVNVRVIAATNKTPQEEVRRGRMRADLFFRLCVLDLYIPPLRSRKGDIPELFRHFLGLYGEKYGTAPPPLSKQFARALEAHLWPGNVRELENLAEKYVILGGLSPDVLQQPDMSPHAEDAAKSASLDDAVIRHVQETLNREGGNIARTAACLGVDRNTVKRWLAKMDRGA